MRYEMWVILLNNVDYTRHTFELEYKYDRTYGLPVCMTSDSDTSSLAIF